MSVLIKGMEIDGKPHKALITEKDGQPVVIIETALSYDERSAKVYPLVEVKTPHGELIERKSAKVRFCQHCHWKESIENACEICVACPIDLIPTIVDAEGGGEDG